MKYTEAVQGRIFVIRLEDGDVLHEEIERLAEEKNISAGMLLVPHFIKNPAIPYHHVDAELI
jgi:predicted DNA-binding protein with PD1-like motif